MIRILFICHGNICRSPMAEFCMKNLVRRAHRSETYEIASAGTSDVERGHPVFLLARNKLAREGIGCAGKVARQITAEDYTHYDYIVAMSMSNADAAREFFGSDPQGKISLLLDYTDEPGNVRNPWVTGDYDAAWEDIERGCRGLFEHLEAQDAGEER